MVELFNNIENKELVFNFSAQGIDPSKAEVKMLVLLNEGKAKNLFFLGSIVDGKVRFTLPAMEELSESEQGTLRLEVVTDGEYFKPWESEFKVKTKRSISVTESVEVAAAPASRSLRMDLEPAPTPAPAPVVVAAPVLEKAAAPKAEAPNAEAPKVETPAPVLEAAAPAKAAAKPTKPVVDPVVEPAELGAIKAPMSFTAFMKNNLE